MDSNDRSDETADERDAVEGTRSADPGVDHGAPPEPAGGDSIADLARQPVVVAWTKFVGALLALMGFGMGFVMILLDIVDKDVFEGSAGAGMAALDAGLAALVMLPAMYFVTVVVAAFLGVFFGRSLATDDTTTYLVAAISLFVGGFALTLLGVIVGSVALDGLSVDFGGLFVTAVAVGIGAAAVAAGGVWTARALFPADVDANVRSPNGRVRHARN